MLAAARLPLEGPPWVVADLFVAAAPPVSWQQQKPRAEHRLCAAVSWQLEPLPYAVYTPLTEGCTQIVGLGTSMRRGTREGRGVCTFLLPTSAAALRLESASILFCEFERWLGSELMGRGE